MLYFNRFTFIILFVITIQKGSAQTMENYANKFFKIYTYDSNTAVSAFLHCLRHRGFLTKSEIKYIVFDLMIKNAPVLAI
jgi:Tfp pilus assembly protein PilN